MSFEFDRDASRCMDSNEGVEVERLSACALVGGCRTLTLTANEFAFALSMESAFCTTRTDMA